MIEENNEIWKTIDGYPQYKISNLGRVKSISNDKTRKEKILKTCKVGYGYLKVNLSKDGNSKNMLVHRLVCNAFLPNPYNLPEVNHINEDKTDNRLENLEFCDHIYNQNFGTRIERISKANSKSKKGVFNTKLSKAVKCLETGKIYPSLSEINRQLGFNKPSIQKCCVGKQKSAYKLHWQYV